MNDFEGHSRSLEIWRYSIIDRPLYHFLLVVSSNDVLIFHRFRAMTTFTASMELTLTKSYGFCVKFAECLPLPFD